MSSTNEEMSSTKRDCLTAQAPEILLQIISHLSSKEYLALVKTNRALHGIFKKNSSVICNIAIERNFPESLAFFRPTMIEGWLTPTNSLIILREQNLIEQKLAACNHCRWLPKWITAFDWESHQEEDPVPSTSCPLQHSSSIRIKLSLPGPQFLSFLERYDGSIKKCWYYTVADKNQIEHYGEMEVLAEFEDKVGVHVKTFLRHLDETGMEGGFRDTQFERTLGTDTRRDLDWYYGEDGVGGGDVQGI